MRPKVIHGPNERPRVVGGEGIEPPADCQGFRGVGSEAAQKAAHGWRGTIAEAGALRRHGARGGLGGVRAGWARPRAHGATWRLRGREARGQRAGRGRSHGSSLAQAHALGPTEELAGAIEIVSGGCHRFHRYRNGRPTRGPRCSSWRCTSRGSPSNACRSCPAIEAWFRCH
jgi:hypothetical protein